MRYELISGDNPHRPHLLPSGPLVVAGPEELEAARAPGGGAGRRAPLVRGGAGQAVWNGVGPEFLKYERDVFGHIAR